MNNIGEKIKKQRILNNISQQELADLLFVSNKTISSWENERTVPDIDTLFKISNILKISFYELVYGDVYNNLDNIELEVKIKVDENEWDRVINIVKNNSDFIKEENHQATYFYPKYRDFLNEWLRVRNENGKYILNYKRKENKYCDEFETIIDNFENLAKILKCLNFEILGKINKKRSKYLYKNKYEISFDEVDNIGKFIEIEVINKEEPIENEYNNLINLIKKFKIDLNLIDNKRYADYLIDGINKDE